MGWANDLPRARFRRRTLAFIEDGEATVSVVAWQDIVRVDLEGIWLEVLAVELDHQHVGSPETLPITKLSTSSMGGVTLA